MSTDLNAFTHFNLVIHLSKVQQLAFRLFSLLRVPLHLQSQGPQWSVLSCAAVPNIQKPPFLLQLQLCDETWHARQQATGMSSSCRCGLFGFWWGETCCAPNSLELESRFMPIGARLDHGPGAGNNRTTSRKLGTESCFNFLWFHQLIPIGPLSHAFFPPQVGWLRRVLRCL